MQIKSFGMEDNGMCICIIKTIAAYGLASQDAKASAVMVLKSSLVTLTSTPQQGRIKHRVFLDKAYCAMWAWATQSLPG